MNDPSKPPPSTTSVCPVIHEARSLARNSAAPAMSSGTPSRFSGVRLAMTSSPDSHSARARSVFTSPGAMALTRTPGARSAAIVGGDNGRVSAVLMQQGQLIWQQRISQPSGATEIDRLNDVDTTPVIVDGVVYALGYNGNLTALDLRSGQIIWKRELGSVNDFIVDAGRIYLIDQNDRVVALSTTGAATPPFDWNTKSGLVMPASRCCAARRPAGRRRASRCSPPSR